MLSLNKNLVNRNPDTASVNDFRNRVQEEIDNPTEDEAYKLISDIADILNIKPKVIPPKTENSDVDTPENVTDDEETSENG